MGERGFSLIELVVTLAVTAILLLAVSPSLTDWMINLHIRNAADGIQQGLQLARQEAIKRNQDVSFYLVSANATDSTVLDSSCALSSSSGSWVVSVDSPAGKCNVAVSATTTPRIVAKHAIGDGATNVTAAAFASDGTTAATTVTFNGFGRIANSNAVGLVNIVSASDAAKYRSLRVVVGGDVGIRLCDPAVEDTNPHACP
jgi:type IV fimbrial biogenesis protein FimT